MQLLRYTAKRILQAVPLLLLISILCFLLMKIAPYDAIDAITTPNMSEETVAMLKEKNGLNEPVHIQYIYWLRGILQGELGYSIVTHESIANDLMERIPNTIFLVLPAYTLALVLSLILGSIAGYKKGRLADKVIDGICSIGIAIPSFWLAMVVIYVFGYMLDLFPILGMTTAGVEESLADKLHHLVLPGFVLMIAFLPELTRYVRSSTIGQLSQDYVAVQRAYGESDITIVFRHVLRNVLLPIVTIAGMSLPILVTGAIVTETVFGWPGIGPYFVKAIQGFDYPVVMAVMLISAALVIIGNLLADLLYVLIDPRIKEMR